MFSCLYYSTKGSGEARKTLEQKAVEDHRAMAKDIDNAGPPDGRPPDNPPGDDNHSHHSGCSHPCNTNIEEALGNALRNIADKP